MLQMMNKVFGGTVHRKSVREDGVFNIALDNTCSLFRYSAASGTSSHSRCSLLFPPAAGRGEPLSAAYLQLECVFVSVCDIRGLQKEELVLLTHGDSVDKVADGFKVVAQSGNIVAGERAAKSFHFLQARIYI